MRSCDATSLYLIWILVAKPPAARRMTRAMPNVDVNPDFRISSGRGSPTSTRLGRGTSSACALLIR